MKKFIRISAAILILLMVMMPMPASAGTIPEPIIDGDTVYIDDDNVYLSATPHTITSSGWVEFQLISKQYSGDIDVAWGFGYDDDIQIAKPQIWRKNAAHHSKEAYQAEALEQITIHSISDYQTLISGVADIGTTTNTNILEITVTDIEYSPTGKATFIIAYDTITNMGADWATFNYYALVTKYKDKIDYYDDWVPISAGAIKKKFYAINYDLNYWHYKRSDVPIEKGVVYKMRCWVDIPFAGKGSVEGEYFFGVKPSHETISEAWSNGHLYLLDPWYNSSWGYRAPITFDNSASAENLTNFPVLITCNATNFDFSQANVTGNDIRFTDADGTTLLEYFVDDWDSANETGTAWVKVPQIDAGSTTDSIFMYWGNAGAASAEDTEKVFGDWASINDCDSADNWTGSDNGSGSVTPALDTVTYNSATGSINATVVGDNYSVYQLTYTPGQQWDFSADGATLDFWFRATTANTSFDYSRVYLYDSANESLWWFLNYSANTWTHFSKPINGYNGANGTFDNSAVEWLEIEIHDGASYDNFTMYIDTIENRQGAVFAGVYNSSNSTVLNDATRYGNDGDLTASDTPVWVQEANGVWALSFDGTNDVIRLADIESLDNPNALSAQYSLKHNGVIGATQVIASKWTAGGGRSWQITLNTSAQFYARISEDAAAVTSREFTTTNSFNNTSAYYDVTFTEDIGTDTQHFYVNGTDEAGSKGGSAAALIYNSSAPIDWGERDGAGDLTGNLTALRLYNYILSADWAEAVASNMANTFVTMGSEQTEDEPAMTTNAAVNVTMDADGNTFVVLSGNLTNLYGHPSANCSFQYGENITYTTNTTVQVLNATGNYTQVLTGLTPGTTYYYRAQGVNDIGYGYGDNLTFTYTMPSVLTTTASGTNMAGDINSMGVANTTYVYFDWGYDNAVGNPVLDGTANATGNFTYDVSTIPVDPLQTIYYRIRAVCGAVSANGSVLSFTSQRQVDAYSGLDAVLIITPVIVFVLMLLAGFFLIIKARKGDLILLAIGLLLLAIAVIMFSVVFDPIDTLRKAFP